MTSLNTGRRPERPVTPRSSLRILFMCDQLAAVGGIERFSIDIATALDQKGHRISLVYRKAGEYSSDWRNICRSMVEVPTLSFSRLRSREALTALQRSAPVICKGIDVIYVHNPWESVYGRLLATAGMTSLVCHLHLPWKPVGRLRSFGLRGVDRYVAVSQFIAEQWRDDIGKRAAVVPNGIDAERWRPLSPADRLAVRRRWGIPDGARVVVYAGRFEARKGPDVLIRAFRQANYPYGSAHLLLVGGTPADGRRSSFEEFLQSMSSSSSIQLLPRRKDLRLFFGMADLVAFPSSEQEAFGLVSLEAMACGTPVIATDVGGVREQFAGRLARLLVAPRDVDGMAKKIRRYLTWRESEPALGSICRRHVQLAFPISRTVTHIDRILQNSCFKALGRDTLPRTEAREEEELELPRFQGGL